MSTKLAQFSADLRNELINCRYCMEKQGMNRNLAYNIFEVSRKMVARFIEAEKNGDFSNDAEYYVERLKNRLCDFSENAIKLLESVEGLGAVWFYCNIPSAEEQDRV